MRRIKVGVIGCGVISEIYLKNMTGIFNNILEVVAVADLIPELSKKRAEEFNVPIACSVEELLANEEVEIVVNLTAPAVHAKVNLQALNADKHVYAEKPFALSREDADEVLALAESKGLLVGNAPDTFLGAGIQTCIKLIDDGWIGTPYAANGTIIMGNSSDGMHPNFQNFYKLGGDPILDLGPYYLTALVAIFGSVRRVTGSAQSLQKEITIQNINSPRYGETVSIEAPMNVSSTLDFTNGVVANLQAAKEGFGYKPRLEIFGTEGNLSVPDPNFFGPMPELGSELTIQFPNFETKKIPLTHGFKDDSRGIGVADMAYAIQSGRRNRANGQLAKHVLDISLGIFEASETDRHIYMRSKVDRPDPLPLGLKYNMLDK